jgi:hypothetical protein
VATLSPIKPSDTDKLQLLQQLDKYRQWRSLDDKRYCITCGRVVTGRDIQVIGGTGEVDPLRAVCPTKDCRSIPMDWVLPTNEVLLATEESKKQQSQQPTQLKVMSRETPIREHAWKWTTRFKDDGN